MFKVLKHGIEVAIGTNLEILGSRPRFTVKSARAGRPALDRNLVKRYLAAGNTPAQIAAGMKCNPATISRIRRELERGGEINKEDRDPIGKLIALDFDDECKRAMGYSFRDWLYNKRRKVNASNSFHFNEKIWRVIWNRPSLFLAADRMNQLGDKLAQAFLSKFKEDKKRIRYRKKYIRQLFTFLGRSDINDRHLTMNNSRDPRGVRRVPEISMPDFPGNLEAALEEVREQYGIMGVTWLKMKICTGIRTGDRLEYRGLSGLSADTKKPCYILFKGSTWRAQAFEKKGETWAITWVPTEVLADLRTLYDEAQTREKKFIFTYPKRQRAQLLKAWRQISAKHTGVELTFHDLRKVAITWLYAMNIPLEIATSINVGWKDLSTARDHYLNLRAFLKKSSRREYRENIPEWYKDGLEEYTTLEG